jgi:two-component system, chemotaxis family, sensor kinase CheA
MVKKEMKKYLADYIREAEDNLQNLTSSLLRLEKDRDDEEAVNQFFRSSHTLKSSSAYMGLDTISTLAHKMEDVLGKVRNKEIKVSDTIVNILFKCIDALESMIDQAKNDKEENVDFVDAKKILKNLENILKKKETLEEEFDIKNLAERPDILKGLSYIKVDIKKLDRLMEIVGELLINKLRIDEVKQRISELDEPASQLDRLLQELQFEVTQARMVPVDQIFNKFPRMVRDLSLKQGKDIDFTVIGGEVELDRTVLDKIGEPIIHLLRNAIDHGIEPNSERTKKGKKIAFIRLSAKRLKNKILIEVEDDGRGIDLDTIRKVALERHIMSKDELSALNNERILRIPFDPRFSTSKIVTEVSGRGVGLDVVKNKIHALNGSVKVETNPGKGSKFVIELPLTLAIVQCFLIKVYDDIFAIPLSNVIRCVNLTKTEIKTIGKNEVIIFENNDIPLVRLHSLFKLNKKIENEHNNIILPRAETITGAVEKSLMAGQKLKGVDTNLNLKDSGNPRNEAMGRLNDWEKNKSTKSFGLGIEEFPVNIDNSSNNIDNMDNIDNNNNNSPHPHNNPADNNLNNEGNNNIDSNTKSVRQSKKDDMIIVVVEKAGERLGLGVDDIIGEQEVIIKPLDRSLKDVKGFAGATILGDGSTALILDIPSLEV